MMMSRGGVEMKKVFVFVLLLFFLSGCASSSTGRKIDSDRVSSITRGQTTQAEVQSSFGLPTGKDFDQSGETWNYSYTNSSGSIGVGGLFLNIITLGIYTPVETNVKMQTLLITFNNDKVVKDFSFRESSTDGEGY